MVDLSSGGLTFYGGFLFATPICAWYIIRKKLPFLTSMDIVAVVLMIGLGFGRIGCFLNGCCYGHRAELPWAVSFPYHSNAYLDQFVSGELIPPAPLMVDLPDGRVRLRAPEEAARDPQLTSLARAERSHPVHPTQLYSAFNAFLIAAVCFAFFTVPHVAGRGFALMLILKGVTRFILEMIRTEPLVFGPLTMSMFLSIILTSLGVLLWFVFARFAPAPVAAPQGSAVPATA